MNTTELGLMLVSQDQYRETATGVTNRRADQLVWTPAFASIGSDPVAIDPVAYTDLFWDEA